MLMQASSRSSDIYSPQVLEATPQHCLLEAGCRETYSCKVWAQSLSDLLEKEEGC